MSYAGVRASVYILAAMMISSCTFSQKLSPEDIRLNQAQGNRIVQAISHYQRDHNQLPTTLDLLIPTYLTSLPRPFAGDDFSYHLTSLDGYYLCFQQINGCCYNARLAFWDCSPGGAEN
jgi:hypothetical protein